MSELRGGRTGRDGAMIRFQRKVLPGVTRKTGLWSGSSQKQRRFRTPVWSKSRDSWDFRRLGLVAGIEEPQSTFSHVLDHIV